MSLFDGTSRLAQIAIAFAVLGTILSIFTGPAGGPPLLGPFFLVLAAIPAGISMKRDRDDYAMWATYAALGLCAFALAIAMPSILNAGEEADVTREGKIARDEFLTREASIKSMYNTCVADTRYGCSATALTNTAAATQAKIVLGQDCAQPRDLCVWEAPNGNTLWRYVTKPVKSVGSLVLSSQRTAAGASLETTCTAATDAPEELVSVACGPQVAAATSAPT